MPNFISTFAGIGGFDKGLEDAGWTCVGQVEIDPYCNRVLEKHWPAVPRHTDIRTAKEWWLSAPRPKVHLITGGFPCQDVSVAGKRAGLGKRADEIRTRTGLFYNAIDFITAVRPELVLLENVPGLLTSNGGSDFGVVLHALDEGGYPYIEWRVLDSQHFGVPQRRRRVFVVAGARDPRRHPVLLEPDGVLGDPAPGEQAGSDAAAAAADGTGAGGRDGLAGYGTGVGTSEVAGTLGALTGGYRTTDLDGIGAYVVDGDPEPLLTNPVDGGVARAVIGGGAGHDNKHDATRTSYVVGAPVLMNNGQQGNELARTITTGTGKRFDPDTESMVLAEREQARAAAPRRRLIRRPA